MEKTTVKAQGKYLRQSPYKMRLVLNLIRGLDVQDALNKVYLAYSEVEAGSLPSPATLDSFLDWPLLFNEKLKENPAYNDIISSATKFDELINAKPDCLGELE